MNFRFLLILLLCLPLAAWSQNVPVRSGEHEGFTRLTLSMPQRTEWRITRTDRLLTLAFEDLQPVFDLARALQRIPRARIAGIAPGAGAGTLDITLGCDCRVAGFWYGDALLVLDVLDKAPQRPPAVAARRQHSAPKAALAREPLPQIAASTATELMLRGLEKPDMATPAATEPPAPALDLPAMRNELVRKIGRAASQGLLEPSLRRLEPRSSDPSRRPARASEHADKDKTAPPALKIDDPGAHINLRAETGIDRVFLQNLGLRLPAAQATACLPDERLNVAEWADEGSFWRRIGSGRARLTNEIDRVDPDVARDLAQAYIYFGFGTEAAQVLATVAQPTSDHLLLGELASIIESEGPPSGKAGMLDGQTACPSMVAMWSALAQGTLPRPDEIDKPAILRTFNALPPHLRAHLGPVLARRFGDAGDQAMVADILNILERGIRPREPETGLVLAEAALARGDDDAAAQTLMDVVQSNSRPSAEALIRLVETRIEAGQGISYELAQLAGAYVTENSGTALERELEWAHVMALGASGAFSTAFDVLEQIERDLPAERGDTRSAVIALLAAHGDDITFVRRIVGGDVAQPQSLRPESANAVARRLLALGFPDRARAFVATDADGAAGSERPLLRARAALAMGRPRQAEVDLLGRTDTEANSLREAARAKVSQQEKTRALFGTQEADLAPLPDPARGTKESDSIGTLAQNRALIDDAGRVREELNELLAANPTPVPFGE